MKVIFRYSTFLLIFCLAHLFSYPQAPVNSKKDATIGGTWEAGILVGPDFYFGDLNSSKFLPARSVSGAGGAFITRQFTNVAGLRGQLVFGGLRGNRDVEDIFLGSYNARFSGTFIDFSVNGVFNLSNLFSPYHSGRRLFVYALAGLGVNAWNTKLSWEVEGEQYIPPQTSGFHASLVIPLGIGLQFAITNRISAGVEYTVRTVTSDLVDQTLDAFKFDIINLLSFSASYRFGAGKKSLDVREYNYSAPYRYEPKPYDTLTPHAALPVTAQISSYPEEY